jgi:hypothetical protein
VDPVETSPGPDQFDEGVDHADADHADADHADADAEKAGTEPFDANAGPDPHGEGSTDLDPDQTEADGRDPLRFNRWMKRSATGAVMTGIAVGLQQALEMPKQQPAFVIAASGEPDDPDKPIDLRFDPDSPADTVAVIRRPAEVDPPEAPAP